MQPLFGSSRRQFLILYLKPRTRILQVAALQKNFYSVKMQRLTIFWHVLFHFVAYLIKSIRNAIISIFGTHLPRWQVKMGWSRWKGEERNKPDSQTHSLPPPGLMCFVWGLVLDVTWPLNISTDQSGCHTFSLSIRSFKKSDWTYPDWWKYSMVTTSPRTKTSDRESRESSASVFGTSKNQASAKRDQCSSPEVTRFVLYHPRSFPFILPSVCTRQTGYAICSKYLYREKELMGNMDYR